MTCPLEIRPALSEGIDRQVLYQVRERFLAVNKARLQRAMEGLLPAQQISAWLNAPPHRLLRLVDLVEHATVIKKFRLRSFPAAEVFVDSD